MRRLVLLDTETGGIHPATDPLVEVGLVVWSVEHRAVIRARSWLVKAEANEAQAVNGISPALLAAEGWERDDVMSQVSAIVTKEADVVVAHRAEFDRSFLPELASHKWLCSKFDIEWPGVPLGASLNETSLALLGYATRGHRAIADCLTLARCFERVADIKDRWLQATPDGVDRAQDNFETWLDRAMRPKILVEVADKSFDAERNALAKQHGFAWTPEARAWRRRIAIEDAERLPFHVIEVTP